MAHTLSSENFFFDPNALERSALSEIRKQLAAGRKLAVALSGGSDSVFLLHIAKLLCQNGNITALHFNHKVRKNADVDEAFCKTLCKKLGVKIVVKSREENLKKISEESLRKLRGDFFERECKKLKIDAILQGHIKTDVAETMLMRLMRGSALEGLCAPRPVAKTKGLIKIRPILTLSKPEIQSVLKKFGIDWREDESNFSSIFLRNKIRNEILPLLENLHGTDFPSSAFRTRSLLEEDAKFIEDVFLRETKIEGKKIYLSEFAAGSQALLRRAAQKLLAQNAQKLRAGAVDLFLSECLKGKTAQTSLKTGFMLFNSREKSLEIIKTKPAAKWKIALDFGENKLPNGDSIFLEEAEISKQMLEQIKGGNFDESEFAFIAPQSTGLFARNTQPSDAYAPIGSKSKRLVKDMMSAKKTPVLKRKSFPLVCLSSGEAIWSPSLAIADFCKLNGIGRAFRLTYKPAY